MIFYIHKHIYGNENSDRIRAEIIHERKNNEQQNIIIFQARACITEIDTLIILFLFHL